LCGAIILAILASANRRYRTPGMRSVPHERDPRGPGWDMCAQGKVRSAPRAVLPTQHHSKRNSHYRGARPPRPATVTVTLNDIMIRLSITLLAQGYTPLFAIA
jgi:hypothetical protein